jgi:hypothetical protein
MKKLIPLVASLLLAVAGCGGGGGGSTSSDSGSGSTAGTSGSGSSGGSGGSSTGAGPSASSTLTNYLVDGPTKGLSYACSPSGLSGVTGSDGAFICNAADTATFSLNAGNAVIALGSIAVPAGGHVYVPVTMLPNGLQVAEILQALNHGSATDLDVGGVSLPAAVVTQINAYIASGGTLPAGQPSDDAFLASVQSQVTAGAALVNAVHGTGTSFRDGTVLPHLASTIVGVSANNPPPVVAGGVTKLSGTIVVSGSGTVPGVAGCTDLTWSANGGGIVNATVDGDIQTAGAYPVSFASPGFRETIATSDVTCTSGGLTTTVPGSTTTYSVSPFDGNGQITVTAGSAGNALSLVTSGYTPPEGCNGGGVVSGTDVGRSNPLITLSTAVNCSIGSATASVSATAKLVGAW